MSLPASRFTRHAVDRAREMGLTVDQLRSCLERPSATMKALGKYAAMGATVYHRDGIACVVAPDGSVLTILYSRAQGEDRFCREADNSDRLRRGARLKHLPDVELRNRYRLCSPYSDDWKRLRQEMRRRGLPVGSERRRSAR